MQNWIDNSFFSTAYFPPIEYFILFLQSEKSYLEVCESFVKQTYRNRCLIPMAEHVSPLIIPVSKSKSNNCPIKEIRIDYSQDWQRTHWKTIETAYNTSPFFLYYRDYLEPFFLAKKISHLLEFNNEICMVLCKLLKIEKHFYLTESFQREITNGLDLRNLIHPKKITASNYKFKLQIPYQQVFQSSASFIPNMSIIDLLFNKGPHALDYLREHSFCNVINEL